MSYEESGESVRDECPFFLAKCEWCAGKFDYKASTHENSTIAGRGRAVMRPDRPGCDAIDSGSVVPGSARSCRPWIYGPTSSSVTEYKSFQRLINELHINVYKNINSLILFCM